MDKSHSDFHSSNAFCGSAGPEEMQHLHDLIDELTDEELNRLVKLVGIGIDDTLEREAYELVIDEADREDFYREYKNIISLRDKR